MNSSSDKPIEDVIDHRNLESDTSACFCEVPLQAKILQMDTNYEQHYTNIQKE